MTYQEVVYPCLVYYLEKNKDFNKTFTLDDIPNPTKELYEYVVSDWMTLGRPILSYDEWAITRREYILKSKIAMSKSHYILNKISVDSFEDIKNVKNTEGFIKFADTSLNEHFGVNQ